MLDATGPAAPSKTAARPRPASADLQDGCLFAGCADLPGTPFTYAREEEVHGEGEAAEFVYRVLDGAGRTHTVLSDGRRQITGFHLPGDLFGFEQGRIYRHTAEALCEVRLLIFKRRQIERVAAHRVEVACRLWGVASDRLRLAEDLVLLLGRRSALERVAAFLLEIDRRLGRPGHFDLPMTRRDIADYLGLTLETVSRTVSQLESERALLRSGTRSVTLRRGRLERLIEA